MAPVSFVSGGSDRTREIGERLGSLLTAGDVVLLHGDLGAGKTTFAQGIARGMGIDDYVQSPTFTIVAEHRGDDHRGSPVTLYHLDLYRLRDIADLESFGFEQYLQPGDGVSVIEWPERAGDWLPAGYLLVELEMTGPDERWITIGSVGQSAHLTRVLGQLIADER